MQSYQGKLQLDCGHLQVQYHFLDKTNILHLSTRMKWHAIEPNKGDFITEVSDNMIHWAKQNNIIVRGKNNCEIIT